MVATNGLDFERAMALMQDDWLTPIMLPLMLSALVAEVIWSWRSGRKLYKPQDTLTSLVMLAASLLIEIVPKVFLLALMFELHEWSPLRDVIGRQPWAWVLLFLLDDITYYFFHRMNHEVRFFWAGHVNHHSSEYMNYGTALRQGVGERVYKPIFWLWLPAIGFDPAMVVLMMIISLSYQFWTHTEAVRRFPAWYEAIFNTPSHHRVHHGSNTRYLDRNHAGTLIIWDKLFGTFSAELDEEPVRYGLTTSLGTDHPWTVLSHGYTELFRDIRRATKLRDRIQYVLQPPGWSHDGPDKRAQTLRAAQVAAEAA